MSPAPSARSGEPVQITSVLRAVTVVGPPLSVATGLLFYFGWVRTATQAAAMGLDDSLLAMSTRDYVLRSLNALYVPILVATAAVLAWLTAHIAISLRLRVPGPGATRWATTARWTARTAWLVVPLLAVLLALVLPAWGPLLVPLSLALGFLLCEWGHRLHLLAAATGAGSGGGSGGGPAPSAPRWAVTLRGTLIGLLVTAALFWEVADYAAVVGRGSAAQVARTVTQRPAVTVYSVADLQLDPRFVTVTAMSGAKSAFAFRYTGLRLLQISGGRVFLFPDAWSPGRAPLIVLRDADNIRLEISGAPHDFV